jgi:glycerophosphoryl diester phosphodiesterase
MAKRIQFRRGTTAQTAVFTGAPGEITVDIDKKIVVVHDGVTPGGFPAFSGNGSNPTFSGVSRFTGQTFLTGNIASTSTATGTLVVTGGVGISGRLTVNNLVETSSITFKENVQPLSGALDSIRQLIGVVYDRKDKSSIKEAGLIAEDVDRILPNVVVKDKNGNPYGIQYTKIIAYLVEAIKEQQQQIDDLKKKV